MSDKRPAVRVRNAILAHAWAMLPESLETMLSIADRQNLSPEAVAAQIGRPLDNTYAVEVREGVGIIPVNGPISRYMSVFADISGGTSIEALATDLHDALANPAIGAILLAIDSPGGEVNGVAEFADMVYAARGEKPIVAYVSDMGASAAYWIASACEEVVVASTAIVGSIGVVMGVPNPAKDSGRLITFVSSQSPHKRPDPTTQAGGARLQATVDALGDLFVAAVARNRGVDAGTVASDFGQGDVLIGQAAVDAGLADRLGSYEGVVAELQQRAREPRRIGSGGRMAAQETGGVMADEQRQPGFWTKFWGNFGAQMDDSGAPTPAIAGSGTPATPPAPAPAMTDPRGDAEIARLNAELAHYREAEAARATADLDARATAFADGLIRDSRALPAERAALVAAYADAATDDAAHPRPDGQPSRVARLEERQQARPAHALTTELVPVRALEDGTLAVLDSPATTRAEGAEPEATPERYRDLLASNPTTRRILAEHGIPATGALSAGHRALLTARMEAAGLVPAAR